MEKERAIIDAINNWEMGFLRADEMIEIVCELDDKVGAKVLERFNRIKASDEYLNIVSECEQKINEIAMRDEGIRAMINYHRIINLKE